MCVSAADDQGMASSAMQHITRLMQMFNVSKTSNIGSEGSWRV